MISLAIMRTESLHHVCIKTDLTDHDDIIARVFVSEQMRSWKNDWVDHRADKHMFGFDSQKMWWRPYLHNYLATLLCSTKGTRFGQAPFAIISLLQSCWQFQSRRHNNSNFDHRSVSSWFTSLFTLVLNCRLWNISLEDGVFPPQIVFSAAFLLDFSRAT